MQQSNELRQKEELQTAIEYNKNNFTHFSERCLKIRTKSGSIEQLKLNTAQLYIHSRLEEQKKATGKVRAIILKGRQQGASTYVQARFYHKIIFDFGLRAFILTHEAEATSNLFDLTSRYHDNNHPFLKPETANNSRRELYFNKLDSGYKVGTAGNKGVGRSQTIQYFHGSEVGFWANADEISAGLMQGISSAPGTEIILESTGNGIGNFFHRQWQAAETAESEYIAIFVPWFWQEEYSKKVPKDFTQDLAEQKLAKTYNLSKEQIMFRRKKIVELAGDDGNGEWKFKQEYPMCATEAFQTSGGDTLIKPEAVQQARKTNADRYGAKVIGVDPALGKEGGDRTAIAWRQGRSCYRVKKYESKTTMQMVAVITSIIEMEHVEKVFIDVVGIGIGMCERLDELGYGDYIEKVNGGSTKTLLKPERYRNKRAEMWSLMAQWLKDEPCQIPDSDELQADLCAPFFDYNSNSQLVLEQKKDMKKRGIRSPDLGDALAMTFALPVRLKSTPKAKINRAVIDNVVGY